MEIVKRILKMGEKKIVIIPKNSELKAGEMVGIGLLNNIQDNKEETKLLMGRKK